MIAPYYEDDSVILYRGDMREVLPALGITADAAIVDPPYGETSLTWDRWVDGWPDLVAEHTNSMWCFGSMRLFGERWTEFTDAGWRLSQDVIGRDPDDVPVFGDVHVVWEKPHSGGFAADRFKRVHEHVLHWYSGTWSAVRHETPRVSVSHRTKPNTGRGQPLHTGTIASAAWSDDGTRLIRSVLQVPNMWRRGAIHPTEKSPEILAPLIEYAVPQDGLVLDPFAGSGSTLLTARRLGRRAIGIEANEEYCERAAKRLSTPDLFSGEAS